MDEADLENTAEISTSRDRTQRATDIVEVLLHSTSLLFAQEARELDGPKQVTDKEIWGAPSVQKSRRYAIQPNGPQLSKCVRLRLVRVSFRKNVRDCDE